MTFPEAIANQMPPDDRLRIGIVTNVSPVRVSVQGVELPGNAVGSYTPVLGDNVAVLRQDNTWLVLGKTSSSDIGSTGPVLQAGQIIMSVSAATSATANVTFIRPFTRTPAVATNINDGSAGVSGWSSRAFNITTTGFIAFIYGSVSTFNTPVQWQALEYTQ